MVLTFQLLLGQTVLVPIKVEEFFGDHVRGWFVLGVVIGLEVGVPQRLLDRDALDRIEREQSIEQVQR